MWRGDFKIVGIKNHAAVATSVQPMFSSTKNCAAARIVLVGNISLINRAARILISLSKQHSAISSLSSCR